MYSNAVPFVSDLYVKYQIVLLTITVAKCYRSLIATSKIQIQIPKMENASNNNVRNKRAQRALGRSPEEKVKSHSGANNREPQGHNLNNFGRGPFDDVIY